jgi:hypothetical protein
LLALLCACETVRVEYHAPETAEGRQCVVQCAAIREACRANENQRAQAERRSCERRAESTYLTCLERARGDKEQQARCERSRPGCSESPNHSRCGGEYDQCFTHCGGTVTRIIEKR